MNQLNEEYKTSLKEMGMVAQEELNQDPTICTCTDATETKTRHGNICLHHQLVDWMVIIDYQQSKAVKA